MDVAQALRIGQQIVRNLFAREVLGESPPSGPPDPAPPRNSLARALFAPERLGVDPEPAPSPRRRTLAQALFAPEPLPEEPPAAPRPARTRWLRWLVVPESLDPPP